MRLVLPRRAAPGPLLGLLCLLLIAPSPALAQAPFAIERDLPHGRFYTQAGSATADPTDGFAVVNHMAVPGVRVHLWDAFQRLGGPDVLGYPASREFDLDGFRVQTFQKGIAQWVPGSGEAEGSVAIVNVFDELSRRGLDQRLLVERQVPLPLAVDDRGKTFEQVAAERLTILDQRPALARQYASAPHPLLLYGLPNSQVQDFGPFYAVRLQRAAFQEWKVDAPGIASAGEVTVVNAGDLAKEYGLVPDWAMAPQPVPATSEQVVAFSPGSGGAISSPATLQGDARAFEATVLWELTDATTGDVLSRSFTTALTCCEWAAFHADVHYSVAGERAATLAVWGASGRGDDRPGEVRLALRLLDDERPPAARDGLLLMEPRTPRQEGTAWTVTVRLSHAGAGPVDVAASDFRLRDDASGRVYTEADGSAIRVLGGEARELTLRFIVPERVGATDLRLLHAAGGGTRPVLTAPVVLDLPDSTAAQAPPSRGPALADAVQAAIAAAAAHVGVDPSSVSVVSAEAVEWSDSSLGCPRPGQVYLQVITPGYRVVLRAGGRTLEYHTDMRSRVVLCAEG